MLPFRRLGFKLVKLGAGPLPYGLSMMGLPGVPELLMRSPPLKLDPRAK